jgi:uncharacterized protein YcbK (DUF882 family)
VASRRSAGQHSALRSPGLRLLKCPGPRAVLVLSSSMSPDALERTPSRWGRPPNPGPSRSRTATSPRWAPWIAALLITFSPVYVGATEIVHVVGKGQTLGRIAKRYRVSVDTLREVNGLRAGDRIHPGLSLVIPRPTWGLRPAGQQRGPDPAVGAPPPGKTGKALERGKRGGAKAKEVDEKGDPAFARGPLRRGFVRLLRGTERLEVQILTRHGHLAPVALAGFSRILRFYPTGATLAIDPRLAALVGQVSDHFHGRPLHVVSGFRPYSPVQYTAHSNHNVGRAMDFSVDGVPNTVVRDFCRTFRSAGVGYYPNSSFVHLDVRTGKAYWIDYSHPGEAPHYDSPSAQKNADEAAVDVEPHPGVTDPSMPAPDLPPPAVPGSPKTP